MLLRLAYTRDNCERATTVRLPEASFTTPPAPELLGRTQVASHELRPSLTRTRSPGLYPCPLAVSGVLFTTSLSYLWVEPEYDPFLL